MSTVVVDVPARSRYEVTVDGELAGFAEYRLVEGAKVFTHTEVFDAYEGQGIGSVLARGALDDVRSTGRRLVARCPFISGFIARHDEYADLVDTDLTAQLTSRRTPE